MAINASDGKIVWRQNGLPTSQVLQLVEHGSWKALVMGLNSSEEVLSDDRTLILKFYSINLQSELITKNDQNIISN